MSVPLKPMPNVWVVFAGERPVEVTANKRAAAACVIRLRPEMGGALSIGEFRNVAVDRLTEQELADRCRVKVRTVQKWRRQGTGPTYIKAGGVRYLIADVEAWERSRRVEPSQQEGSMG